MEKQIKSYISAQIRIKSRAIEYAEDDLYTIELDPATPEDCVEALVIDYNRMVASAKYQISFLKQERATLQHMEQWLTKEIDNKEVE